MPLHATIDGLPDWRRNTATALLLLAALGAVLSFAAAAASIGSTETDATVVSVWQLFGFLVFAGLFVLLAYRPHQYPGVWELVIFHKAVTAAFLALFASGAAGATTTIAFDAVLAIVLLVAYLLVRGYTSWDQLRRSPDPSRH